MTVSEVLARRQTVNVRVRLEGYEATEPDTDAAMVIPAAEAMQSTFTALGRNVATITTECQAIRRTLDALDDALSVVSQGGDSQAWSGFGLVGLPILGAVKAIRGVAGQYVKERTGEPLSDWTDFVARSSQQLNAYVEALQELARVAGESRHVDGEDRGARDLETLTDVRWQTRAWKHVLASLTQLGTVVDAILEAGTSQAAAADGGEREAAGVSGVVKRRLKDVQSSTFDRSAELREWVLRPFIEVRDGVKKLPRQVERVAHDVALLEILLDLGVAQLRAQHGEISPAEARVIGIRVAATTILPELAQELSDARLRAATLEGYLDRLASARADRRIDEQAYAVLENEYQRELTASRSRLAKLEASAGVWKREGPSILDDSARWAQLELDVLAARRLVEQHETVGDRTTLLERELERLNDVRSLLDAM